MKKEFLKQETETSSLLPPFKNALVSVSNKKGLVEFIRPLAERGMRVVSTGGTFDVLKKAGVCVEEVRQQTGFGEVMEGRVKSLHPHIYMPLLARPHHDGDSKTLEKFNLSRFDLVVCNLYPFEEKKEQGDKNLVEWIDVGGPSLIRAAAKNFASVTILCDPADYKQILEEGKIPDFEKRKQLAGKAFSLLAHYNSCIADHLLSGKLWNTEEDLYLKGNFFKKLRYGENPGQKASWFYFKKAGLQESVFLQGKELSFNNICDLNSAVSTLREFKAPCCVAIKHNNPCGVACDDKIEKAVDLALKADPLSVFGAIIAVNQRVCERTAQLLCSLFLEAVIAPDYSPSALELFSSKKKNLRILKWPNLVIKKKDSFVLRSIDGGILIQENQKVNETDKWNYMVGKKPDISTQSELLMAWKICVHLKSNAIALVSEKQTVGLGMGQVNRVAAVETAIQNWKKFHSHILSPVIASDGFFPFTDSIERAAEAGIKWIIQPGGSLRDKEVIAKAKELSINVIFTGQRCFSH